MPKNNAGVNPDRNLPDNLQDKCPYCGWPRKDSQGNNGNPRCQRQGCPGQHVGRR